MSSEIVKYVNNLAALYTNDKYLTEAFYCIFDSVLEAMYKSITLSDGCSGTLELIHRDFQSHCAYQRRSLEPDNLKKIINAGYLNSDEMYNLIECSDDILSDCLDIIASAISTTYSKYSIDTDAVEHMDRSNGCYWIYCTSEYTLLALVTGLKSQLLDLEPSKNLFRMQRSLSDCTTIIDICEAHLTDNDEENKLIRHIYVRILREFVECIMPNMLNRFILETYNQYEECYNQLLAMPNFKLRDVFINIDKAYKRAVGIRYIKLIDIDYEDDYVVDSQYLKVIDTHNEDDDRYLKLIDATHNGEGIAESIENSEPLINTDSDKGYVTLMDELRIVDIKCIKACRSGKIFYAYSNGAMRSLLTKIASFIPLDDTETHYQNANYMIAMINDQL